MKKRDIDKLDDALFNRAIGFSKDEISEEYSMVDEKLTLIKKKLNSKYYPPELKAIEILMEKYDLNKKSTYDDYSLDELNQEKERLLKLLKESEERAIKNDNKNIEKK